MNILRLYGRVLALLGSERPIGVGIGAGQCGTGLGAVCRTGVARPHHRHADRSADATASRRSGHSLATLLAAWAGFGLFTIACGTLIALYADRLAHRRRHVVLTGYFEHVLQLPLSYHGNTHSGRLMKMMLQGTEALWGLWVGFLP